MEARAANTRSPAAAKAEQQEAREETVLRLSHVDYERFLAIAKDDSPPNDLLREEAARYRAALASGRLVSRR